MVGREAERLADRLAASQADSVRVFSAAKINPSLITGRAAGWRAEQVTEMMLTAALPANPAASLQIPCARRMEGVRVDGCGEKGSADRRLKGTLQQTQRSA